jgi:glycosyltransferase involved in cell wall biosynthesis
VIRLYGEFTQNSSQGRVSRGFADVFSDAAQYDLWDWGNDLDEAVHTQPGATAKIGIFVGNLSALEVAFRARHERLYVMVAPNSNVVGPLVEHKLAPVKHLLAPSRWAGGVLKKIFPDKEILVVPHGVDRGFRVIHPKPVTDSSFKVLHLSSTILERKGTDKLLEGWALVKLRNAKLFMSVPEGRKFFFQEEASRLGVSDSVLVTDRLNHSVRSMTGLYNSMDFVCQPSRGEGFGMVPVEARACGTPVIMTSCTGHSEHADTHGVVLVETGDDAPVDDFPGAYAPSLSAEAVAYALRRAHKARDDYKAAAKVFASEFSQHWSWENRLREFKDELFGKFSQ